MYIILYCIRYDEKKLIYICYSDIYPLIWNFVDSIVYVLYKYNIIIPGCKFVIDYINVLGKYTLPSSIPAESGILYGWHAYSSSDDIYLSDKSRKSYFYFFYFIQVGTLLRLITICRYNIIIYIIKLKMVFLNIILSL